MKKPKCVVPFPFHPLLGRPWPPLTRVACFICSCDHHDCVSCSSLLSGELELGGFDHLWFRHNFKVFNFAFICWTLVLAVTCTIQYGGRSLRTDGFGTELCLKWSAEVLDTGVWMMLLGKGYWTSQERSRTYEQGWRHISGLIALPPWLQIQQRAPSC